MIISWDHRALADLDAIATYIAQDNIPAAVAMVRRITDAVLGLADFPHQAREGRIKGTRELVVAPYVVAYRIRGDSVVVKAVLHGRQRWPRRL